MRVATSSRILRFGAAIRASSTEEEEDAIRRIPLPGLPDAQSQVAVPMLAQGALWGVLFAESPERLAFRAEDAALLGLLANQAATRP